MPELPDLENFKGNIYRKLTSKKLIDVNVYNPQKVITPQSALKEELVGRELAIINRLGKELLFDFAGGRVVAVHLMLNGKISIVGGADDAAKINFRIFSFVFEKETVVFSDMGGLCTIRYKPSLDGAPDALGGDFTLEYFLNAARRKRTVNVKSFLIDQKVIKGIGNAYADEILWLARVSPYSTVGQIPEAVMIGLYNAIGSALRDAIASIKAISPDIISGEERSFLKVHNKSKKRTDTGFPIIEERIASKITYYTEEQILYS